jgi:hypothetical protein
MIKSEIEKQILSQNINKFTNYINIAPINILIKIIPFLCAWGNLSMLNIIETRLPYSIDLLPNKEICMRMSLLSDNYDIIYYLNDKNCMSSNDMLRYYVCRGGDNSQIYKLLDLYWNCVSDNDILYGIKNGTINTIRILNFKTNIPCIDYSYLPLEKQKELLKNNNIFNYYYNNSINDELILNILLEKRIHNLNFIKHTLTLKKFFKKIKCKFYIIK